MSDVLRTFSLEIVGPPFRDTNHVVEMAQTVNTALNEAEENLSDLLPDGYSVRIKEWDEADESWKSGLWRNTR